MYLYQRFRNIAINQDGVTAVMKLYNQELNNFSKKYLYSFASTFVNGCLLESANFLTVFDSNFRETV